MKKQPTIVSFKTSKKDALLIIEIAVRAVALFAKHDVSVDLTTMDMDIAACHVNDCRLDLEQLLAFSDFDFLHDVSGIRRHLDRRTGKLQDCFVPRCSLR